MLFLLLILISTSLLFCCVLPGIVLIRNARTQKTYLAIFATTHLRGVGVCLPTSSRSRTVLKIPRDVLCFILLACLTSQIATTQLFVMTTKYYTTFTSSRIDVFWEATREQMHHNNTGAKHMPTFFDTLISSTSGNVSHYILTW